jgi:hypothetical protein
MNIKILCKNIENNHTDFNADRLEELFTEFAKEYHKEQLNLYGVSHRRELLKAEKKDLITEFQNKQLGTEIMFKKILDSL